MTDKDMRFRNKVNEAYERALSEYHACPIKEADDWVVLISRIEGVTVEFSGHTPLGGLIDMMDSICSDAHALTVEEDRAQVWLEYRDDFRAMMCDFSACPRAV